MLRPSVAMPDIDKAFDAPLDDVAEALTTSMREATIETKQAWRNQITAAGLGGRLANTIRSEVYPKGRNALNPAGYLYTKAPKIIAAFATGATIRPVNGAKYLWIPTKNVPRKPGRGRGRMSPEEVELHFNAEFRIVKGDAGELLALLPVVGARSGRGHRQATKGRLAQGRKTKDVLMFTLRRTVRLRKRLDLQELADLGGNSFALGAAARLGR